MHTINIRNAIIEDMSAVQAIYSYHVENGNGTFEEIAPTIEEMVQRFNTIVETGYPFLVASINNKIVGYCYANIYRARSAYRYTVENSVFIADGYTGQGIGHQLLQSLINNCRHSGFKQVLAFIGDSANHASINLHYKLGFKHTGIISSVGFKFNRWLDVVIMQLKL